LRDEVKELERLIFGSKKERFVPAPAQNQLSLLLGEDLPLLAVCRRTATRYTSSLNKEKILSLRDVWPTPEESLSRPWITINPEPKRYCCSSSSYKLWNARQGKRMLHDASDLIAADLDALFLL